MRTLTPLLATALLTTTLVGAGGCASDNYYDDRERYGYSGHHGDMPGGDGFYDGGGYYDARRDVYYDTGPYIGRPFYYSGGRRYYRDDDYYRRHRQYHREARDRVARVPRDASVVANGREGLEFSPNQSGRVYVRDEKTGKVVYGGRVQPGDQVKVAADAKGRRVSVNGETARGDLSARPRDREVYFRPDRGTVPRAQAQAQTAAARERGTGARSESRSEGRPARPSRAASSNGDGDGSGRRK